MKRKISRQSDSHSCSRGFVHLTVYQRCLVDNTALFHFSVKVISFTRSLTDTGEDGNTAVCLGHVVDQLHDQDRLADAGASEQTDLAALCVGADQVYDLDAGLEDLSRRCLVLKGRCRAMDRPALLDFGGRLVVNRLSEQIEYTPKALITYRNGNGTSRIDSIGSANQSVCGTHRNAADYIVTDLLRYFSDQFSVIHIDLDRIQQLRQFTLAES